MTYKYLLMMLLCKYVRPVLSTARRLVGVGGTSQTMLSSQTEPGATQMELRTTFAETGCAFQAMLKDLEFGFLKYCTFIYSLIIITLFMTLIHHFLYSALNSSNASMIKRHAWNRTKKNNENSRLIDPLSTNCNQFCSVDHISFFKDSQQDLN